MQRKILLFPVMQLTNYLGFSGRGYPNTVYIVSYPNTVYIAAGKGYVQLSTLVLTKMQVYGRFCLQQL